MQRVVEAARVAAAAGAALAISLAVTGAKTARAAASDEPPMQLEELTVTGERSGPRLWHVHRGTAQLWILGSVSPLPKDMTWRSKELEAVLDTADQVLVAKPVEVGIARAMWLMVTEHSLLLAGHGKRLKDLMPADLYARFARQRARFTDDPDKWERYRPLVASAFLEEDALHRIGLSTRWIWSRRFDRWRTNITCAWRSSRSPDCAIFWMH